MIPSLYKCFLQWSEKGSVYLISDTHFMDNDCLLMDKSWIPPQDHVDIIRSCVHKNDTLIHLGDVGHPEWMKQIRGHKVLVMGNHDETRTQFESYFDEIFEGPLMISEKIILSHEPIYGLDWAYNIHGHDHNPHNKGDANHLNLAANVVEWQVYNLKDIIRSGVLKNIKSLHRATIDHATERKQKQNQHNDMSEPG